MYIQTFYARKQSGGRRVRQNVMVNATNVSTKPMIINTCKGDKKTNVRGERSPVLMSICFMKA